MDEQRRRRKQEGELAFARIHELQFRPVKGSFNTAHLKEIHRRIFQDLPQYAPGEFRPPTPFYTKERALESTRACHVVFYAPRSEIDVRLDKVLATFCKPEDLKKLSTKQFSERMATFYGDLDHLHPFKDGNSRTLRTFTAQLAQAAGRELSWEASITDVKHRDMLYVARDKAVLQRYFPGLDEKRAMETNDRAEYEAYMLVLKRYEKSPTLKDIIEHSINRQASLTPKPAASRREIRIPDDYKPSPDAIAGTEHLRAQGIPERKVLLAMYGIDLSNQVAQSLGIAAFKAKTSDAEAKPQSQEKQVPPLEPSQSAPKKRK